MSLRRIATSWWIAVCLVLCVALPCIGPCAPLDDLLQSGAPAEHPDAVALGTTIFALDGSSDGTMVLACLRGEAATAAPLLLWTTDGIFSPIPAPEALIDNLMDFKAALFPDGQSILIAASPLGISRIDLDSGMTTLLRSLDEPAAPLALALAPDGRSFAIGLNQQILVCGVDNGREWARFEAPRGRTGDIAFSPDGALMATSHGYDEILVWALGTGSLLCRFSDHSMAFSRVRFVGSRPEVATTGYDGSLRLWDLETAETIWQDNADTLGLRALAISPDGLTAATGGFESTIRIYDLASRALRAELPGHSLSVTALAFVANGSLLASAGDDGRICIWDAAHNYDLVDCCHLRGGKVREVK